MYLSPYLCNLDLLHCFPFPRFAASSPPPSPPPLLLCIAFRRLDSRFTHPLPPERSMCQSRQQVNCQGFLQLNVALGRKILGILEIPYEYCNRDEAL